MAHGGCRVKPPYHKDQKKTERISIVASKRKRTEIDYVVRREYLETNFERALQYLDMDTYAAKTILEEDRLNLLSA
jgi:hypothetical protein